MYFSESFTPANPAILLTVKVLSPLIIFIDICKSLKNDSVSFIPFLNSSSKTKIAKSSFSLAKPITL